MHFLGMRGMPRRIYDYTQYALFKNLQPMNQFMTICLFVLGAAQIILVVNFFLSMRRGKLAGRQPVARRRRSSGRRPRRRPTRTSRAASRPCTAGPTSTAFPATARTSRLRTRSPRARLRQPQGRMDNGTAPVPPRLRGPRRRGDARADRRGRPRHVDRVRAVRARLADDVRPQHVHVPPLEDGRRDPVRAHPPPHRVGGRLADDRAGGLARAARGAALGPAARLPGPRDRRRAGHPRGPDGALPAAHADLGGARLPRADLLLPHGRDRRRHLAALASRRRPPACAAGVPAHAGRPGSPRWPPRRCSSSSSSARSCATRRRVWRSRTSRSRWAASCPRSTPSRS